MALIRGSFIFSLFVRNPLAQMEEERRDHEAKMKKMEQEMEQVFEMKVKEKTQKLKDSETDVTDSIVAFPFFIHLISYPFVAFFI
jgi:septin 7